MKVLILNKKDIVGGAARAAYRLYTGLQNAGIDSSMLVMGKNSNDLNVIPSSFSKYEKFLNNFRSDLDKLPLIFYPNRKPEMFSPSFSSEPVLKRIMEVQPDIIHLHWIPRGFMKIEDLVKINCPIVWSLHDMWPFTGGCHYDGNCCYYEYGCGNCPILNSGKKNDLSRRIFNKKKTIYRKLNNLTIIGLSNWMAECARKSKLFRDDQVITLPNGINTNLYKPIDKLFSREIFNLPMNKKLILFGAMDSTSEKRKGYKYLIEALESFGLKDVELVIFGASKPKSKVITNFKQYFIGNVHDDFTLAILYSAADVVVVPSIQENLSNVIMESLACGTPVVGFDIGGNSDMIKDRITGYLAKPLEPQDLTNGIHWVLENESRLNQLSINARNIVLEQFSIEKVTQQYIKLYENMMEIK